MDRIYHTWDKWECYSAGFYENKDPHGRSDDECEKIYKQLLTDQKAFECALARVIAEWKHSCEHYLTNERMNRIAWMGQSALAITHGIPSRYRGGFNLLSEKEQYIANQTALKYINRWMRKNNYPELMYPDAQSKTKMDLY